MLPSCDWARPTAASAPARYFRPVPQLHRPPRPLRTVPARDILHPRSAHCAKLSTFRVPRANTPPAFRSSATPHILQPSMPVNVPAAFRPVLASRQTIARCTHSAPCASPFLRNLRSIRSAPKTAQTPTAIESPDTHGKCSSHLPAISSSRPHPPSATLAPAPV